MRGQGETQGASDRTARAVATQLRAMACERYEIGILAARGVMLQRTWGTDELEHAVPWLKRMNAQGNDIYIRPAGSVGLLLMDDLTSSAIERLRGDGLAPALVVETSPGNCQAWVRVSSEALRPELATAAARILAERYGSDPNSADWRHFGRLAGFTNRKRKHERHGLQPYVLLRESRGAVAERGQHLLAEAETRLHPLAVHGTEGPPASPAERPSGARRSPGEAYTYFAERIKRRYGGTVDDESLLDWSVCKAIARTTLEADQSYLEEAMRAASPGLQERKAGHVEDYVARTARKVFQDGNVIAAREQLAQKLTAHQNPGLIA